MTRAAKTTFCYLLLSTVEVMKGTSQKEDLQTGSMKWNQRIKLKKFKSACPYPTIILFWTQCYLQLVPPGAFFWSFSSLHLPVENFGLDICFADHFAKDRLGGCSNVPLIRRGMRQKRTPQVFLRDLEGWEGLVGSVDGIKEPWFQTSPMFAGWGPKSFKVKTSKPFFPFGHRPNLHAISILWQQLRFTQDMPVYRVHEAKPGQFGGHRNRFSSFHHWFLFRCYGSVNGNMSCSALNNPIYIYVYNLWTYGSLVRSDFKHWLPMPGIIQVRNALRKKPYHLGIPRHSKLAQPMGMV